MTDAIRAAVNEYEARVARANEAVQGADHVTILREVAAEFRLTVHEMTEGIALARELLGAG